MSHLLSFPPCLAAGSLHGRGRMTLDVPTLAVVAGAVSLMQSTAFVVVWSLNRQTPGIGRWTICSMLSAVILLLVSSRLWLNLPLLTQLLPTLLNWTAAAFFYTGAAAFQGRRAALKWPLLGCIPLLIGYVWFALIHPDLRLRPLFYTPGVVIFLGLGARELFAERRPGLRFATAISGYATVLYCASLIYRALILSVLGAPAELLANVPSQIILFVSSLLWVLGWTFTTMLLVNQRQSFENQLVHRAQMAAAEELTRAEIALAMTERELAAERAQRQQQSLLRDLHDGVGGVTANLVLLASLGRGDETSPERQELLRHIEQLAIEGNREVRLLMDVLQKGAVEWPQFLQELREHAKNLTASQRIALDWQVVGKLPNEPLADVAAQLSLMRCCKEAIHNLTRHSQARHAQIRVSFRPHWLSVRIKDDGIGTDAAAKTPGGGRGMANMRRRSEELGGRFTVLSGRSCRLRITIPLPVRFTAIAKKPPICELAHSGPTDGSWAI